MSANGPQPDPRFGFAGVPILGQQAPQVPIKMGMEVVFRYATTFHKSVDELVPHFNIRVGGMVPPCITLQVEGEPMARTFVLDPNTVEMLHRAINAYWDELYGPDKLSDGSGPDLFAPDGVAASQEGAMPIEPKKSPPSD